MEYTLYEGAAFEYESCMGEMLVVTVTTIHVNVCDGETHAKVYCTNNLERKRTYCLSAVQAIDDLTRVKATQVS